MRPQVLLLASRFDLTCDYVVAQLRRRSLPYLRLNSEDLNTSSVVLDPVNRYLEIECGGGSYSITPADLRSVFFRRPVFLRDYGDDLRTPEERFSRLQWASFVRNLMLFDEARWLNDPVATYRAEHKAVQLAVAARLGFAVPNTRVTNAPHNRMLGEKCGCIAVKGLDTVLVRAKGHEMFGYTTFAQSSGLEPSEWQAAPATIQVALKNKLDVRVTVVANQVFAASITANGEPIGEDWRRQKANLEFSEHCLPRETADCCRLLVRSLGLLFGGIDLALCEGEYCFLEINPTGEWAWLVDEAGLPIDAAIADELTREGTEDVG